MSSNFPFSKTLTDYDGLSSEGNWILIIKITNAVLINYTINTLSNLEVNSLDFDLWASNSENSKIKIKQEITCK